MATTTLTQDYKLRSLKKGHDFSASGGFAYWMLLIKSAPGGAYDSTLANVGTPGTASPSTTNVGTDEVVGAGYTSGGFALTNVEPTLQSGTATTSFSVNPTWTSASFTASSSVIYTKDTSFGPGGRTVGSYDFGGNQTVTNGTFTVVLPTNSASAAIVRIN